MITFLGAAWWPPILQTAIGGLLAIAGGVLGSWLNWRKERKAVSAAVFEANIDKILEYCQRTLLEKSPFFTVRPRGIFQDFLTLNKVESIFNPVEFRERLANDIDQIKPRASALISKLRR
jgi:hypothetical protein